MAKFYYGLLNTYHLVGVWIVVDDMSLHVPQNLRMSGAQFFWEWRIMANQMRL